MIILSLDPSLTNYGWVVKDHQKGEIIDRGKFVTSPREMDFVRRLCYLRGQQEHLCKTYKPDAVGIESPVFKAEFSEGLYALFCYSCEAYQLTKQRVVFFSPGQAKARAWHYSVEAGVLPEDWPKSEMGKSNMIDAARSHAKGGRWNDHEADAYWVGEGAYRFWALHDGLLAEKDLTELDRFQFTRFHTYQKGKKAGKTVFKGLMYKEAERFFLWNEERDYDTSKRRNRDLKRAALQKDGQEENSQEKDGQENG